jgi:hypothetical protein
MGPQNLRRGVVHCHIFGIYHGKVTPIGTVLCQFTCVTKSYGFSMLSSSGRGGASCQIDALPRSPHITQIGTVHNACNRPNSSWTWDTLKHIYWNKYRTQLLRTVASRVRICRGTVAMGFLLWRHFTILRLAIAVAHKTLRSVFHGVLLACTYIPLHSRVIEYRYV